MPESEGRETSGRWAKKRRARARASGCEGWEQSVPCRVVAEKEKQCPHAQRPGRLYLPACEAAQSKGLNNLAQSRSPVPIRSPNQRHPVTDLTAGRSKINASCAFQRHGTMADDNNATSPEVQAALAEINAVENQIALTDYDLRKRPVLSFRTKPSSLANISQGTSKPIPGNIHQERRNCR
jgi:hypothetical protein